MENHYQTLGVVENATDDEIKKAYRTLAKQWHPDHNPGNAEAVERFKKITEAYDVLKDPARRRQFDQERAFATGSRRAYHGAGQSDPLNDFYFRAGNPFADVLRDVDPNAFWAHANQQRAQTQPPPKGRDIEIPYSITLEEVFQGKETEITYSVPGIGKKVAKIKIPAGIEDGMKVRYPGAAGTTTPNSAPADLYVSVNIVKHSRFTRDKADLTMVVDIDAIDSALGTNAMINCIDGTTLKVKIPAGTQHGQKIRVRGRGLPVFRGTDRGDLYVEIGIKVPTNLTDAQRAVLLQFKNVGQMGQA